MFPKGWEGPILDESEFKQSNGKYPSATRRLQSWHGNNGHGKNSPDKSEAWHEQKGAGVTQQRNMKDRNIKDWAQTHRTAPCFT